VFFVGWFKKYPCFIFATNIFSGLLASSLIFLRLLPSNPSLGGEQRRLRLAALEGVPKGLKLCFFYILNFFNYFFLIFTHFYILLNFFFDFSLENEEFSLENSTLASRWSRSIAGS
jgi:hypothetical protein